jgi:hypothetical protein
MRGPKDTGDIDDPVARSIRNEQNQAARPTREEARRMSERALRERGCDKCSTNDPDALNRVGILSPDCPEIQHPPEPFSILCDEHLDERADNYVDSRLAEIRRGNSDAAVVYTCGIVKGRTFQAPQMEIETQVGVDDHGDAITETKKVAEPRSMANATARLRCRCGAGIDRVVYDMGADE